MSGNFGQKCVQFRITDIGLQHLAQIDKAVQNVDVIVLCYSVSKPFSFEMIETRFTKLIKAYTKSKVIILAGLQSDTRFTKTAGIEYRSLQEYNAEKRRSVISRVQGERLAEKLKLKLFMECSAVTKKNIDLLFQRIYQLCQTELKKKTPTRKSPRRKNSIRLNLKPFTMQFR